MLSEDPQASKELPKTIWNENKELTNFRIWGQLLGRHKNAQLWRDATSRPYNIFLHYTKILINQCQFGNPLTDVYLGFELSEVVKSETLDNVQWVTK